MSVVFLLGLAIIAYLLGAFPSGVVLGKTLKGVDVRQYGSGKTGATNSLRTLGWQISLLVFVLDNAKGALAVWLPFAWLDNDWKAWGVLACGLASMLGHDYSIFIGFQGGRGVAVGMGQVFVLSPLSMLFTAFVDVPLIAITRYVSLASVVGCLMVEASLVIFYFLGTLPTNNDARYLLWGTAINGLIIWQHRDNIQRLLSGTERKLGEKAKTAPPEQAPSANLFANSFASPTKTQQSQPEKTKIS